MASLGDFLRGDSVRFTWNSFGSSGQSITRSTNGTISVYKDGGLTQTTTGVTDTEDFDSLTGVHHCLIATTDAFYVAGSNYSVILSAATIDGQTVNACLAEFSIEFRSGARLKRAGTAGGVAAQALTMAAEAAPGLDFFGGDVVEIVSATTGAGTWNMVQTSTNANPPVLTMVRPWPVTLTGTVVYRIYGGAGAGSTVAEVGAGVLAAAAANPISASTEEILQSTSAATSMLAFFDGTGYAGTNNVIPTVTTVTTATNVTTVNGLAANTITATSIATGAITAAKFAAGAIDAAAIANGAIDAATFAADVDAEVLSYLVDDATRIDASALNTAAVTSVPAILVDTGTTLDAMLTTLIAGDVSYKKNVAVTAFEFFMRADDGTPGTGATVTASISKDGGAFAGVAGAVTELTLGWYKVDLAQAEMNADEVGLNFAATGHLTTAVKIRTQS